jgi:transcriptional regulator with XRE-family HTH domain
MEGFGDMLRRFRFAAGLSQRQLAKLIDLNPSHLSRIEKGAKNPPKRGTIQKMTMVFNLTQEQEKEWFELAGYSWSTKASVIGFTSPLQPEAISANLGTIEKIADLDENSRKAVESIVDLLAFKGLSDVGRSVLSRQVMSFSKGLREILEQVQSFNDHGSNHDTKAE